LYQGASRGLGLGLTNIILKSLPNCNVVAACRTPETSTGLQSLVSQFGEKRVTVVSLETTEKESYAHALKKIQNAGVRSLDVVIANAGVSTMNSVLKGDVVDMMHMYKTNVVGTMLTMQAFNDMLVAGGPGSARLMMVMSSILGSVEKTAGMGSFGASYRASKCALNMLARAYSEEKKFALQGGKVIAMHPGKDKINMWLVLLNSVSTNF
jgi:norsolorinic acid ketoreductase